MESKEDYSNIMELIEEEEILVPSKPVKEYSK